MPTRPTAQPLEHPRQKRVLARLEARPLTKISWQEAGGNDRPKNFVLGSRKPTRRIRVEFAVGSHSGRGVWTPRSTSFLLLLNSTRKLEKLLPLKSKEDSFEGLCHLGEDGAR